MPVDFDQIAERFSAALRDIYDEPERVADPYAEALRRALGYRAADEQRDNERALPYEHLNSGFGLTTESYHLWDVKDATALARMQAESAEERVKEMRAEVARVYREARKDLAEFLRDRCNERTVPSRYRREGVEWAADMIDPAVPKDQYGHLAERAGAA